MTNSLSHQSNRSGDEGPILRGVNLVKNFGGFRAVDNIDITVDSGAVHALIGPNGAGKTTCFNLLTGFLTPTSGSVWFKGSDITGMKPAQVARLGMTRSFQLSAVFPSFTVLENVRVALQRKRTDAFSFWRSGRTLRSLNDEAMHLLQEVGLEAYRDLKASELSYGRKRALEMAATLAAASDLLLLDEPMSGLGTEDIDRMTSLIRRVAETRTVLMVEHNLGVVASICDRITVLARGKVIAEGTYAAVSSNPAVVEAYIGVGHE